MYNYNKRFKKMKRDKWLNPLKFIGLVMFLFLMGDFFCFWAWILSGQPMGEDSYGVITREIIRLFI